MNESISWKFSKKLENPKVIAVLVFLITLLMLLISNLLLKTALSLMLTIKNQDLSFLYQIKFIDFFKFEIIKYPKFYLLALILISIFNIKIIYKIKNNFGNIVKGQKGTSEFTSIKELREQYKAIPEKKEEYEGKGGVPISREGKKIYIDDSPVNNLIIGTTRSGKGETFVFPSIDIYSRAKEKASMIINDPKGELVSASYDTLTKRGYDIQVLNLLEPLSGMSYNPLQLIIDAYKSKEYSKAQTLCNTLTFSLYNDSTAKDKFWQTSAQSLVNAIILALTHDFIEREEEEKITMYAVANFLSEYGSKEDEEENNALDQFFQNRDSYDVAKMQYATSNFAKGTTRGGIFASAMVALQIFTFEEIAKMTSKSSYNLSDVGFGEKPVAIFMVTPDFDASNHVIASIFVRQLYYILAQKASLSDGQKCSREVKFILDEFGNMPPIEGMANIITVCLSRNIRFDLIIQSYSQLSKLYGEDKNTIVGNCGNQIYILTNDLNTAEHFSKLVGYKTISTKSRSGKNLSLDKSQTEGVDKRELLTPNELMSLKEGESVVVRVIKRQDKRRNRIKPKPIFNTGKTTLKYRYEYLASDFNTENSIKDIKIKSLHKDIDVRKLIYTEKNLKKENIDSYENEIGEDIELSSQNHILLSRIFKKYTDLNGMDTTDINKNVLKEIMNLDEISDKDKTIIKEKILGL